MTLDEAIDEVAVMLGFQANLNTRIQTQILRAQQYWEQQWPDPSIMPWFLLTERITDAASADEERVARPDDWLADVENGELWVVNDDGEEFWLEKGEVNALRRLYGEADAGLPTAFTFDGYYYRLFPTPDADYDVKMQYFKQDDVLSDGGDTNLWLTHASDVLVGRAALVLLGGQKSPTVQFAAARQNDAIKAVNARTLMVQNNRRMTLAESE